MATIFNTTPEGIADALEKQLHWQLKQAIRKRLQAVANDVVEQAAEELVQGLAGKIHTAQHFFPDQKIELMLVLDGVRKELKFVG